MSWVYLVIAYLVAVNIVSVIFTARKLRKAYTALISDGLNNAQRYQAEWKIRAGKLAFGVAVAFLGVPVFALIDALIEQQLYGLWVVSLAAAATIFTIKQVDDDRSHDALGFMLETEPGAPHTRRMDQEVKHEGG